jgi:NADH dehydrogenase
MFNLVTVLGGSGFLGSIVVSELCKANYTVRVISKNATSNAEIKINGFPGQIELINYDLSNTDGLKDLIGESRLIINLVGVIEEKGRSTFTALHRDLPGFLARFSQENGARIIHISALFDPKSINFSKYAKSKYDGEYEIIRHKIPFIILKPSVLIGKNDSFTSMFECFVKFPILPLVNGGNSIIQPLYAPDLAKLICALCKNTDFDGMAYEIAGTERLKLKDFIAKVAQIIGVKPLLMGFPLVFFNLINLLGRVLPKNPLPKEFVILSEYDSPKPSKPSLFDILKIPQTSVDKALDVVLDQYSVKQED